jgi:hypothetical protein
MGAIEDAIFVCTLFSDCTYIVYKIKSCGIRYQTPIKMFKNEFVCVTDVVNNETNMPKEKHMKDRDIISLRCGWLGYVFLMAIATIFKGNISLWFLISVCFYIWRCDKIQKEGTYIEW